MRFRVLDPSGAYVHEKLYGRGEIFEIEDDDPRLKAYQASARKHRPGFEGGAGRAGAEWRRGSGGPHWSQKGAFRHE